MRWRRSGLDEVQKIQELRNQETSGCGCAASGDADTQPSGAAFPALLAFQRRVPWLPFLASLARVTNAAWLNQNRIVHWRTYVLPLKGPPRLMSFHFSSIGDRFTECGAGVPPVVNRRDTGSTPGCLTRSNFDAAAEPAQAFCSEAARINHRSFHRARGWRPSILWPSRRPGCRGRKCRGAFAGTRRRAGGPRRVFRPRREHQPRDTGNMP